jgi:hypothetical protein
MKRNNLLSMYFNIFMRIFALISIILSIAVPEGHGVGISDNNLDNEEVYDDFQSSNLDTTRWVVELPKDARLSTAHVLNGDLRIYGNGKPAQVTSTHYWRLPRQGEQGTLQITWQIRPWQRGKYGEKNICDSGVLLLCEQGRQNKLTFGFRLTFPEYSDGNYILLDGGGVGNIHKSTRPIISDIEKYDYLRITLGRNVEGRFCEFAASNDGKSWQVLHTSSPQLPEKVRLAVTSTWGHLAVGSIRIEQTGDDKKPSRPMKGTSDRTCLTETAKMETSMDFIPILYVPKMASGPQPKIDGRTSEPVWKTAPRVDLRYVAPKWPAPVTQQTQAKVCYDDEKLYIAFSCHEDSMNKIWAVQKTGGPIWSDDCVEVFIEADSSNASSEVFHAAVNSLGSKVDESGLQDQWSCAAFRGSRGWSVEMAIPFSVIGRVPLPGECWSINFNRQERPHGENSTWAPVRGSFHDKEKYGRIVFGTFPVRISGFASKTNSDATPGGLIVALSCDNSKAGEVTIESQWDRSPGEVKTIPARTGNITIPWPENMATGYHKNTLKLTWPGQVPIVINGGRIWIDQGLPLASTFWPTEDYNNVLYLANGGMTFLYWIISDTRGGAEGYTATLETPEWVEIFPPAKKKEPGDYSSLPSIAEFKSEKINRNGQVLRHTIIKVNSPPPAKELSTLPEYTAPFRLWLRATVPGTTAFPVNSTIKFQVSRKGLTEPVHEIPLVVLSRIHGKQPKRFPIFAWTNGPTYPQALWSDLAAHFAGIGLNGLMGAPLSKEFETIASLHHLQRIDYCPGFCNSTVYLKEHPDHAAVLFNGSRSKTLVCPEILLEDNSEVFKQVSSFLNEYCPSLGLNWDLEGPPIWNVCFCERCLAAFRKHAGLSSGVSLTPQAIQNDPVLNKAWIDFALEQSKRMIIKWDQRIAEARPGARLFINGGQATNPRVMTDGRLDWRRILPHIGAGQMFRYIGSPQASATSFHVESLKSLELVEGAAKTPMMAVLTTGYMRVGERMVFNYPELTTLQMVQMAAIGFDGIYYWHWYNNDGRFDNAIARGTTLIARYEDFFVDGRKLAVPDKAVKKSKYALVLGRTLGTRVLLFLLNYDPNREGEIVVDFDKVIPGKKWFFDSTKKAVDHKTGIKVGPLDLIVLQGE